MSFVEWYSMLDVTFDESMDYDDLSGLIDVELKLIGGWLCIETPIERRIVSDGELRYDGVPRNVINYALTEHPNETVTIFDLKDAKLATSRDLRQIAIKAGIKGYVRALFMPVCDKYRIKLISKVSLRPSEAEALIASFYY